MAHTVSHSTVERKAGVSQATRQSACSACCTTRRTSVAVKGLLRRGAANLLEQPRGLGIERITGQEDEAR